MTSPLDIHELSVSDIEKLAERDPRLLEAIIRRAELEGVGGLRRPYVEALFPA